MKSVQLIIVPVDFSENTRKLSDYALEMASKLKATAHFIHVVTFYSGDAMFGTPFMHEYRDKLDQEAKENMENLIRDSKIVYPEVSGTVLSGEPVETIVRAAREKKADLIIACTHGFKGIEKILLGSVTERVLKRAHCPMLIMRPEGD